MKKPLLTAVILIIAIIFLIPVKVTCGAPGKTCAPAPDADGKISYYYVYEPLGVRFIESWLDNDIKLHYDSGFEKR